MRGWTEPIFPQQLLHEHLQIFFVYLSFLTIVSFLLIAIILVAASIYVTVIFKMLAFSS